RFSGMYTVFSERLDRVHMKKGFRAELMDKLPDLLHRHYRTHFIINIHNRYQDGVRPENRFQRVQLYPPLIIYRHIVNFETLLLKKGRGLAYRRMLHHSGHDMVSAAPVGHGRADQRQVVGFRAAGGKKDFFFLHFQDSGNDPGRFFYVILRFHAFAVHGGGIAVILHHGLYHDILYRFIASGGGGIIKIYFHFIYSPLSSWNIRTERIAIPAVSVRRILFPRVMGLAPFSTAIFTSSSSNPPSGPIKIPRD